MNHQELINSKFHQTVPIQDGHETRSLLERFVRLSGLVKSYLFRGDSIGLLGDVDVTTNAPVIGQLLKFNGTNWVPAANLQSRELEGRFELFINGRWNTWSDANYGPSLYDWDLNAGTGATPNVDWDGIGLHLPKGAKLIKLVHKVRGNSNDIDDIEYFLRVHDVDLTAGAAIDSNAEVNPVTIAGPTVIDLDGGPVLANDLQLFEIDLGGYVVQNDGCDLHYAMRAPTGSVTQTRQIRGSVIVYYEMP